jgi:ACS family hexuronate transporter-like MFS transporter
MKQDARRWIPSLWMMVVSTISYVDRHTLALLSPTILAETHLSAEQYGWLVSSFSVAYMLGNPLWGRWLDTIGVRLGMTLAVLVWTAASVTHAFVATAVGFAVARAVLGFGEGATFPGGFRTAQTTLPPAERGRGVAIAYSGGSLGALLTPILVTPIAIRWGFRVAFLLTGLLGALWLVGWLVVGRAPALGVRALAATSARPSLRDRRLLAFMAIYALGGMPLGFVLYASPLYLHGGLGIPQSELGKLLFLPPLGWEIGYFVWGAVVDRVAKKSPTPARSIARLLGGFVLCALTLAVAPWSGRLVPAMAVLVLVMFVAAGFIIGSVAYATSIFSTEHSAYLAGLGVGSWSLVVAVVMPFFGRLVDRSAYSTAFAVAAAGPAVGYVLFALLGGTKGGEPA